jgi:hypothetical protein
MKTKLTKCLVLSALAIGMSSPVMALKEVVKPAHAGKLTPVAFEINEGDKTALALLLLGHTGNVEGVVCVTVAERTVIDDDCTRVKGTAEQYDDHTSFSLNGEDLKNNKQTEVQVLLTQHQTYYNALANKVVTDHIPPSQHVPANPPVAIQFNPSITQVQKLEVAYTKGSFYVSGMSFQTTIKYPQQKQYQVCSTGGVGPNCI